MTDGFDTNRIDSVTTAGAAVRLHGIRLAFVLGQEREKKNEVSITDLASLSSTELPLPPASRVDRLRKGLHVFSTCRPGI